MLIDQLPNSGALSIWDLPITKEKQKEDYNMNNTAALNLFSEDVGKMQMKQHLERTNKPNQLYSPPCKMSWSRDTNSCCRRR